MFELEKKAQCDVCLKVKRIVRIPLHHGQIMRLCRDHAQAAITAFKSPKVLK